MLLLLRSPSPTAAADTLLFDGPSSIMLMMSTKQSLGQLRFALVNLTQKLASTISYFFLQSVAVLTLHCPWGKLLCDAWTVVAVADGGAVAAAVAVVAAADVGDIRRRHGQPETEKMEKCND